MVRSPLEGKECVTFYRLLASQPSAQFGSLSTVELRPHTGRTHQLRRHCAEVLRCPLSLNLLRASLNLSLYLL